MAANRSKFPISPPKIVARIILVVAHSVCPLYDNIIVARFLIFAQNNDSGRILKKQSQDPDSKLKMDTTTTIIICEPRMIIPTRIVALGVALATGIQPLDTNTPYSSNYSSDNIPILEVVKIYGKLAGPECYGKQAPKHSSCQINLNTLNQRLSNEHDTASTPSKEVFRQQLSTMEFSWPLKPFGVDKSPSLSKTAVMNKGAETMVFMQELESRNLYDPRNPTGPLPTSLRPNLNKALQIEGIVDPRAIDRTYEVLTVKALLAVMNKESSKEAPAAVLVHLPMAF